MVSVILDRTPVFCPAHLKTDLRICRKKKITFQSASSSCLFLAFFFVVSVTAYSQYDRRVSIGLGPEINMNSGAGFGAGAVAAIDFNFGNYWAAGLSAKASHDMLSAWVTEGMVLIRRYFPGKKLWQREYHSGFFVQSDGGVHNITQDNVFMYEGESLLRFMAGLRIGYRFLLGAPRHFFLEPYARGGYPFAWGAGIGIGLRF